MELPQRILVGSDGSPTAHRAVEVAAVLALALDAPLVVTAVWQATDGRSRSRARAGDDARAWQGERAWAEQVAADAAEVARHAGVPQVSTTTPSGAPNRTIAALAGEAPDTLVVVGAVGLDSGTDRRLGSIPHHLTHEVPGHVLLVRPGTGPVADWPQVVLTTDGSDTSVHAARTGLALARALSLPAVLVSAGTDDEELYATLEEVADRIGDDEPLSLQPVVGHEVSEALADAAEDRGLLVLGNRGMRGVRRLLGSVPDDLVHRLPTDLLLVDTSA